MQVNSSVAHGLNQLRHLSGIVQHFAPQRLEQVFRFKAATKHLHRRADLIRQFGNDGNAAAIGHSTGGVQLAAVLDSDAVPPVAQALLISVTAFGQVEGAEGLPQLRARARQALDADHVDLDSYALGFCRNYVTTAAAFLSYLNWDRVRLVQALMASPIPVTVIYGDKDERMELAWLESLGGDRVAIRAVPGADHFFDLEHEFDLLDEVVRVITETGHG